MGNTKKSRVKGWMGLYMWANETRHDEIADTLSKDDAERATNKAKSIRKSLAAQKEASYSATE
ncbi:MAG: hypothetical protein AAGI23_18640 [Bacteroidota bacterium]